MEFTEYDSCMDDSDQTMPLSSRKHKLKFQHAQSASTSRGGTSSFFPDTDTEPEGITGPSSIDSSSFISKQQKWMNKVHIAPSKDGGPHRFMYNNNPSSNRNPTNVHGCYTADNGPAVVKHNSDARYGGIQFPAFRSVLWDRRPTSSSENFHAHSSLPEVSIESIVFQEIRHEMEAAAVAPSVDSMLGYCIGSLAWNRPQEDMNTRAARTGKSIYIQSFRTQPLMSPHAHTVMIPVFVTSNPTSVEQEQVRKEKQSQMWKAYQLDLERNVAASNQVIVFYPLLMWISNVAAPRSLTFSLEAMVPSQVFSMTCIRPIVLRKMTLSTNLQDSDHALDAALRWGYCTLDATRKLVPMLPSDPFVSERPLVGVWIHGLEKSENHHRQNTMHVLSHPWIRSLLVQYFAMSKDESFDQVNIAPSTCLVVVFGTTRENSNHHHPTLPWTEMVECHCVDGEAPVRQSYQTFGCTHDVPSFHSPPKSEPENERQAKRWYSLHMSSTTLAEGSSTYGPGRNEKSMIDEGDLPTPIPRQRVLPPSPHPHQKKAMMSVSSSTTEPVHHSVISQPLEVVQQTGLDKENMARSDENMGAYLPDVSSIAAAASSSSDQQSYHEVLAAQQEQLTIMQKQIQDLQHVVKVVSSSESLLSKDTKVTTSKDEESNKSNNPPFDIDNTSPRKGNSDEQQDSSSEDEAGESRHPLESLRLKVDFMHPRNQTRTMNYQNEDSANDVPQQCETENDFLDLSGQLLQSEMAIPRIKYNPHSYPSAGPMIDGEDDDGDKVDYDSEEELVQRIEQKYLQQYEHLFSSPDEESYPRGSSPSDDRTTKQSLNPYI